MLGIRGATTCVFVLSVLALGACSSDAPDPRESAVRLCEISAVDEFDLDSPGESQVTEESLEDGTRFEVTGGAEGAEWECTVTTTERDNATSTEITIDRR